MTPTLKRMKASETRKLTTTRDIAFSFDTTGSMYPCLTQVRRCIEETARQLFRNIDDLRIAVIAHGDYCDGHEAVTVLDFTDKADQVCDFVRRVKPTSGGDADECYEYVLNEARKLDWTAGTDKSLVLIGDSRPHIKGERNSGKFVEHDWYNEAQLLKEAGIKLYPIQAMGRRSSDSFYNDLARIHGTPKLELPQFGDITDILCALTYHNAGQLDDFENQLRGRKGAEQPSFHVWRTLDQLAGRTVDLSRRSVKIGSRFQVLPVDENCDIKGFVTKNGLYFVKGRGFYEFTKRETIQEYKEVVAQNIDTGAIITGKRARQVLGIAEERGNYSPTSETHRGFVQSTSVNRKLIGGTNFLYEVAEGDGLEA